MRPQAKGGSTSRPFSWALLPAAAIGALVCAGHATATASDATAPARTSVGTTVTLAGAGARQVELLDCASGRPVGSSAMPGALAAEPVLSPDGRALYASLRGGVLLRYSLPDLREQAHVALDFEATALALGDGPDAVVLAGGRGVNAMSAHDPVTLAELHRYRLPQPFAVAAMRDAPARRRFVVAFADLAEAWEIAYGRDALPVLQGLVHDYRSSEAVPLPGRFTPRRFELPGATRTLIAGPAPYEVARLDHTGALGIVNLDVRREIERPAIATTPLATRVVPWRGDARRGWLIAGPGARHAEVLETSDWRVSARIEAGGEILALAAADGRVLMAVAGADGTRVLRVDVARRIAEPLASGIAATALPLRFVPGSGGCLALVDRDRRWLAGFPVSVPPVR